MNGVTRQNIIDAGYRMSSNTGDAIVARCAAVVLENYILKIFTAAEVAEATTTDEIGSLWVGLTFLRLLLDNEFATRTGGEVKNNQYGSKAGDLSDIKADLAAKIRAAEKNHGKEHCVNDVCEIWLKTQIYW